MRYRLASTDPTRTILTLHTPERPIVITFLAAAALVCLLVGLAYAIGGDAGASPGDGLRAVCFIGFGLFCLCAIFLFGSSMVFPKRLTFDNSTGSQKEFTAPIADIAAIDLSLAFSGAQTSISLLRAEEVEPFTRYRQGTFGPGEVPDIICFLRGLRRIDVSGLPPGRRLALAEALREAVAGRSS